MSDIREALNNFYATSTRTVVSLTLKPVADTSELNPLGSHIGYLGAVTDDFTWPQGYNDQPMCLIAQLNLAELPALEGYPTEGLLQFFVADDFSFGTDESLTDGKPGCLVRLIPTTEFSQVRAEEHPAHYADFLLSGGGFTVSGELFQQPLSTAENPVVLHELGNYGLPTDAASQRKLRRIIAAQEPETFPTIYGDGWGIFFHWDPREVGDGQRLLFQLHAHSADGVDLILGSEGCMSFFIKEDALTRGDFSQVSYMLEVS